MSFESPAPGVAPPPFASPSRTEQHELEGEVSRPALAEVEGARIDVETLEQRLVVARDELAAEERAQAKGGARFVNPFRASPSIRVADLTRQLQHARSVLQGLRVAEARAAATLPAPDSTLEASHRPGTGHAAGRPPALIPPALMPRVSAGPRAPDVAAILALFSHYAEPSARSAGPSLPSLGLTVGGARTGVFGSPNEVLGTAISFQPLSLPLAYLDRGAPVNVDPRLEPVPSSATSVEDALSLRQQR